MASRRRKNGPLPLLDLLRGLGSCRWEPEEPLLLRPPVQSLLYPLLHHQTPTAPLKGPQNRP